MEEINAIQVGLELLYSIVWIFLLLAIFHPGWKFNSGKEYDYKSRKFRLSLVLIGILSGFYALGKIGSFESYATALFAIYSALTGANVFQKFNATRTKHKDSLANSDSKTTK